MNKINVSLFERLIRSPRNNAVPSTTLSIQRRMRKNICDLTREFYREIVEIVDHEICNTKKIGESSTRSMHGGLSRVSLSSRSRDVPGVLSNIFFWTHSGIQVKIYVSS